MFGFLRKFLLGKVYTCHVCVNKQTGKLTLCSAMYIKLNQLTKKPIKIPKKTQTINNIEKNNPCSWASSSSNVISSSMFDSRWHSNVCTSSSTTHYYTPWIRPTSTHTTVPVWSMTCSAVYTEVTDYPAINHPVIRGQHCAIRFLSSLPQNQHGFPSTFYFAVGSYQQLLGAVTARNRMAKITLCKYHRLPSVVCGRRHDGAQII
jgi:hypothetical protein